MFTSEDAVANFFTPSSLKTPEKTRWQVMYDTLLIARYSDGDGGTAPGRAQLPQKIAGFDFVRLSLVVGTFAWTTLISYI